MPKMNFWDTPTKDIPRQYVMQKRPIRGRRRAVRNALSLPGSHLLCVLAGFDSGLFDHNTYHVFVEKMPEVQQQILRRMSKISSEWEPRFWRDAIEKLPLRAALQNQPLEFGFLDFCCALNPLIARWIYTELGPAIADDATLGFTLSRNWRRSPFMRWWTNLLTSGNPAARKVWQNADRMIRESVCTGVVGSMDDFFDDSVYQRSDSYFVDRSKTKWARFIRPEYHNASVDAFSAICVLFPQHTYTLEACIEYQRNPAASTFMTTYVMTNFKKSDKPLICGELLKAVGENVTPVLRPTYF